MEPSEGFNGNGGGSGGGGQQQQQQQQQQPQPPPLQFTNTTAMGRGLGEATEEGGDIVNDFKILANYLTEEGYGGGGELARRSTSRATM